ncbi:MAG: reverse transcriptase family protein, partial [Methyloligellaceae bacterium]
LKTIQRKILRGILDHVPPHECAHGFVLGRSCATAASEHAGEHVVITVDLKDFFPATRLSRVHRTFRSLGYPSQVARALTALCSTITPASVFTRRQVDCEHHWKTRKMFAAPHLPQGAPTSPALANLAAWQLDNRLCGLARSFGVTHTRYADDLAFSGDADLARRGRKFLSLLEKIAGDEGYQLNHRKTRIMRRSSCQRVTGLVVNDHINVSRTAYDELKAILHNCTQTGPAVQNRAGHPDFRAHLDGRITWVESVNRVRGEKLRRKFEQIRW